MKQVLFISSTMGVINCNYEINPYYRNIIEVGNKRINLTNMLPDNIDIRTLDEFQLLIADGIHLQLTFIIPNNGVNKQSRYTGTFKSNNASVEEVYPESTSKE